MESSSEDRSDLDSSGVLIHESEFYKDALVKLGPKWTDLIHFYPEFGTPDQYTIRKKVGRGRFSTVYLAHNEKGEKVAIKALVPIDIRKYIKEIKILKNLYGHPNIVRLLDLVQDPCTKSFSFIFEWVEIQKWRETYYLFTLDDIRYYMRQLLEGLEYAHSHGIIHRDIKPANIGIDLKRRTLKILDWGLAEFYVPGKRINPHAGTRAYLSPEQMIGYPYLDYAVDIWAAGLVFSIMLFNRIIIEPKKNAYEQLINMGCFIGGKKVVSLVADFELPIDKRLYKALLKVEGCGLQRYIDTADQEKCTPEAIDLVSKMLKADFRFRISASDALKHPFFNKK
ncbi:CMGC family protein kinase [Histomonas meleagridis]|uniref:CMGC family protein kinase n=1 Tax=Histomonas meleagridis TaxID=135588 RepID=UPI003559E0AF|nr:CMGC family protein kinase [Histomonas meleagridis]KAH0797399.1 CMGC family protein kinase [Histomonas meleagridis]